MSTKIKSTITYCCIAQKNKILVGVGESNEDIINELIEEVKETFQMKSYVYEDNLYNCICEGEYTFVCVSPKDVPNRVCFGFLSCIKESFQPSSASRFGDFIKENMDKYSKITDVDKVSMVKEQLEQVQSLMKENLTLVLDREDKLKVLEGKTSDLENRTNIFKNRSITLKNVLCCKNIRLALITAGVVVAIIVVIVFAVCGITFSNCSSKPNNATLPVQQLSSLFH